MPDSVLHESNEEGKMRIAVLAAAVITLSVLSSSVELGGSQALAGNYASESTRDYCAKKAKRYADKKAGNRTAKGLVGGAVGGALLGGIFGGSGKDVAAGALIGGGIGAIGSAASNKWYKYYNKAYYNCIND
jgi:hypothetical protein